MSIEDVLRSMRALRAWQDASTPPIRIGAWRVLPWVEPVEFERVEDGLHPHMHVVRPPNPVLATAIAEEPRAELLRPDVLVAMQWKLGNRVATVYRAEADDARVSGALALFALAMRLFAWVENTRYQWAEPRERGVAGMRCTP